MPDALQRGVRRHRRVVDLSENFSQGSLDRNREAGLVVSKEDADLARIMSTFDSDWVNSAAY